MLSKLPKTTTISHGNKIIVIKTIHSSKFILKSDTKLTFIAMLKDGWSDNREIYVNLEGENAEIIGLIFIIGHGKNEFPFKIITHHAGPHTKAFISVRNIIMDEAKVDFKGKIKIARGAKQADSYIAHHSLMLSKNAKVSSIPSLEIEEDDVKAGHAATMGRVNEETLFYLMSRGIKRSTAETLMIKGFLEADLKRVEDEEVRNMMNKKLLKILKVTRGQPDNF